MLIQTHFHPDDLRGIINDIANTLRTLQNAYQRVETSYVRCFEHAQY